MKRVGIDYIVKGCNGRLYSKSILEEHNSISKVCIDSRQAAEDYLFFCIIGERTDAHIYLEDVRLKGCHNVVVSDEDWAQKMASFGDMNVVLVEDTTRALMSLAEQYMDDWSDLKKVAVTGSVGKTSTKEFIYSVLSSKYKTGKTPGNLNSEFGIPLTVFGFDEDIEVAVIEVGIGSGPDMAELVKIIKPDAAVITTIGSSHMEYFGSQDKLIEAKLRVAKYLDEKSPLIVNSDCEYLSEESIRSHSDGDFSIITVGTNDDAKYRIYEICDNGIDGVKSMLGVCGSKYNLNLPVIGVHNLGNAALAVAVGDYMGVELDGCCRALMHTEFSANRLDVLRDERVTVINDTYNASPESMKAGINILVKSIAKRKVAILGDMGELGDNSLEMHRLVGEYAKKCKIDLLITIGNLCKEIARGYCENELDNCYSFATKEEAIKALPQLINAGDLVLVKASRSMGLEEVSHSIVK